MIRVEVTIEVASAPEEVFAYISDFEKNPEWQKGMRSCRWTNDGPLAVGSTYDQEASFLGKKIVSSFEVVELDPGRLVKASSTGGSFPITFTRIVEAEGGGARVTAIVEGDASGFFSLAAPLMRRMVQSSVEKDYAELKRRLEG